ncbi:MAG: hypothetical protein WBW48_04330 [Anaerolineae bacterium]
MSLVQVYLDRARILEPSRDHILVEDISDYAPAYARIAGAIHAGQPLTVVVRHQPCAAWLQAAQEKYSLECVEVVTISHRCRLAELWGVEIPDWVIDEAIARSNLLDVPLRAQPSQSFENVVLEAFYSPFLAYDRLPVTYLADLLNSFEPERWAKAVQRPLVKEVLARRLQAWAEAAASEGERLLVEGLRRDPATLACKLAQVKVLAGYPLEVGRRLLGPEYNHLAALNLDFSGLPVREVDLADMVDQIRVHLNTLAQTLPASEALLAMLDQVSGHLMAEFEALQTLLKSGDVAVDADMVRRARQKFAPIHDRLEQELAGLGLLITPPRPTNPDGTWTADEWLDWAVEHYLPYRFWLEEIGQHDEEIATQADAYAAWLYAQYPALRLIYPRMVYQGLLALHDRLTSSAPVLVVVADNLNYKFLPDLVRYLQVQGFFVEQSIPYLAMLPSCTEVSKKCLFIGQPEPFSGTAYEKPTLEAWGPALGGRRVCYLPHVGALRSVKRREHDVYFLNYLPVDEALHDDEQQTGVPYSAAVRQRLRALAGDIRAFAERIGAERDLAVIVISDHGSTRISAEAPNPIDRRFYATRVTDKHNRYVTISDAELKALPDNVRFECYIFERERFGLPTNYLAARSTYRFSDLGEGIYVHGGLSPEETIVPLAVFAPVAVKPKPLMVRLLADEFRYGVKSLIRLELVNPNQYVCQEVRIEVLNSNVEAAPTMMGDLDPLSQAEVQIETRFRRITEEMTALQVRVGHKFLGQSYSQVEKLPVKIKRIMTTTFDLDEL